MADSWSDIERRIPDTSAVGRRRERGDVFALDGGDMNIAARMVVFFRE